MDESMPLFADAQVGDTIYTLKVSPHRIIPAETSHNFPRMNTTIRTDASGLQTVCLRSAWASQPPAFLSGLF
jgi:hypothetical protein